MKKITYLLVLVLSISVSQCIVAQEEKQSEIEVLSAKKAKIIAQEKKLLKQEVEAIDERLDNGQITGAESKLLKEAAAKKRALNIENRIAIITNTIALLERNENELLTIDTLNYLSAIELDWGSKRENGDRLFGVKISQNNNRLGKKRDRRTYSDFVVALGLNNAIFDGQSLEDSPYKTNSLFSELGWTWRTRVFENTNFLRFHYGFSFQFNNLKPIENQYFTIIDGETQLQEFDFDLRKSEFKTSNLVFPIHFELGPSKRIDNGRRIRYSINNRFRFGIGGYGGFNLDARQKLKYSSNGEKVKDIIKRNYKASNFVYGLSSYIGFDGILFYLKYDLNPIFKNATIKQRNISLGLRFDI